MRQVYASPGQRRFSFGSTDDCSWRVGAFQRMMPQAWASCPISSLPRQNQMCTSYGRIVESKMLVWSLRLWLGSCCGNLVQRQRACPTNCWGIEMPPSGAKSVSAHHEACCHRKSGSQAGFPIRLPTNRGCKVRKRARRSMQSKLLLSSSNSRWSPRSLRSRVVAACCESGDHEPTSSRRINSTSGVTRSASRNVLVDYRVLNSPNEAGKWVNESGLRGTREVCRRWEMLRTSLLRECTCIRWYKFAAKDIAARYKIIDTSSLILKPNFWKQATK